MRPWLSVVALKGIGHATGAITQKGPEGCYTGTREPATPLCLWGSDGTEGFLFVGEILHLLYHVLYSFLLRLLSNSFIWASIPSDQVLGNVRGCPKTSAFGSLV